MVSSRASAITRHPRTLARLRRADESEACRFHARSAPGSTKLIKFDGYRALALRGGGETRILSRNERDLGSKFPAVRDSIAALDVRDAIIGEIVALDEKGRSSF